MEEQNILAKQFEDNRLRLKALAYRMLGSQDDAEDALQESWVRLSRSDSSDIRNLGGWLTTVVARVCLNILRSRKSRREVSLNEIGFDPGDESGYAAQNDPAEETLFADSIGTAVLVLLDTLSPSERLSFVLHDMFDVPFNEVAGIVGCSVPAARKLASRARRRVQGAEDPRPVDRARKRQITDAFLAASREGDFGALLAVLDPEVSFHADSAAIRMGAPEAIHGRSAVASFFKGRSAAAEAVLVDGAPAAMWAPDGQPRVVFQFTFVGERISAIDVVGDPDRVGAFKIQKRR